MRFIGNVIEKLQRHPKRVVFPEGEEPRILQAARQFHALRLGAPILLGEPEKTFPVTQIGPDTDKDHGHKSSTPLRGSFRIYNNADGFS